MTAHEISNTIYIKLFTYTLIIAEKNINNIAFAENGFVLQKKAKAFQTPYHSEKLFLLLNHLFTKYKSILQIYHRIQIALLQNHRKLTKKSVQKYA